MKKIIFILLGFLGLILMIGLIAIWLKPDLSNFGTLSEFQKISSLKGEEPTEENQYQKFISSDSKFEIQYPVQWPAIQDENLLQAMVPQDWADEYDLKTLFWAQNFREGFGQLIIYQGTFDIPIEEIFEKMKESNQNNGWTIEVVKLETDEKKGIFEGEYKNQSGASLHSKEKILLEGKEGYWVSLFALEKDWQQFSQEVDSIINSAKILTE